MKNKSLVAADNCFVCGTNNPIGLKLKFELKEGNCISSFTPTENHVGFYDIVHGGILFTVLDDAMANWFYLQGMVGYTARSEIRFKQHLKVGETALISCYLENRRGNLLLLKGHMINSETKKIIAESEGKFLIEKTSQQNQS